MTTARDIVLAPADQLLKAASKAAIRAFGGQEAAAAYLGTRQQRLSDAGSPNTDCFLRIDEIARIEDATHGLPDAMAVTRALGARQGFMLIPVPRVETSSAEWLRIIASIVKEGGDVSAELANALADDGEIKGAERTRALTEAHELLRATAGLIATLEAE